MKKIYLSLIALAMYFGVAAQIVSIGNDNSTPGTGSNYRSPWSALYEYSYVQTIYLQSEIDRSGKISEISYNFFGPSLENSNTLEIYMGKVSMSEFDGSSYTDWVPVSNLTKVFDGVVPTQATPGWINIRLNTPFDYDNSGNLVIAILEKSPGSDYVSGLSGNAFGVSDVSSKRVIYFVSDEDPIDPTNPPEADNYRTYIGNIKLNFGFPTPVMLKNFSGKKGASGFDLSWTTVTESNNKGFNIQRSADGVKFDNIGFVATKAASGISNGVLNYSFSDLKPLSLNNYYRLQQIDKDGRSSFSEIVTLKQLLAKIKIGTIYPNPVRNNLSLEVATPIASKVNVVVSSVDGKIVMKSSQSLMAGDNKIELNTAALGAGIYTVKIISESSEETATTRFVKQ